MSWGQALALRMEFNATKLDREDSLLVKMRPKISQHVRGKLK